jgi:predicted transcriptional regulator
MMAQTAKELLDRVHAWPQEDVDELAEMAREIEARRTGVYEVTREEEKAIREGLAELERGEWTSEEAMREFWVRCGVL